MSTPTTTRAEIISDICATLIENVDKLGHEAVTQALRIISTNEAARVGENRLPRRCPGPDGEGHSPHVWCALCLPSRTEPAACVVDEKQWMVRELIDDHVSWETRTSLNLIGIFCAHDEAVPVVISCGHPNFRGTLCLQRVEKDLDHRPHLTTWSVTTISGLKLEELKRTGEIPVGNSGTVRLIRDIAR